VRAPVWTAAGVLLAAALAAGAMLYFSPLENRSAGFALWLIFFVALIWPARMAIARRHGRSRPA
jgi:hypothetical protein